jgi:transcription termination/antitermination protein NusA
MQQTLNARTEFAAAINQICSERNIPVETVVNAINTAIASSFEKDFPSEAERIMEEGKIITAQIDPETGQFFVFSGVEGADQDSLQNITPPGFGRIAAQAAKQVIMQTIREAEKSSILKDFADHIGEVMTGMVQRMEGRNVIVDFGRGFGVLVEDEQVQNEFYRLNSRISVYVKEIADTGKGENIIVSRSDPRLIAGLFKREVPEVSSGAVLIKAIAREAGNRAKVAVESTQPGVDPVGSCVGQKGVRVQAVINELNNEKIDIIQYAPEVDKFILSALSPADNLTVDYNASTNEATVSVPQDQLSLAIGRGGQNVKLAAKLTNTRISIVAGGQDTGISVAGDEEFEIDQLGLDTKTRNMLVKADMTKIEDLTDKISTVKGIGPKTLSKIKAQLEAYKAPEYAR